MKMERNKFTISIIGDDGKATELGHCLNPTFKMNDPEPVEDIKGYDGVKENVCTISGTIKISKWNTFKLRLFMKRVYLITWWKSKFNKHLEINVDRK